MAKKATKAKASARKAVTKVAAKAAPGLKLRARQAATALRSALKKLKGSRTAKIAATAAAAGLVAVAGLASRRAKKKRRW